MGFIFAKLFRGIFPEEDVRLLILGLDNAGKTTILYQMKLGQFTTTIPSKIIILFCLAEGFNIESVKYENFTFQMWDVGGQSSIRKYWKGYYPKTKALVFVIDSSDKERLNIVKEEVFLLLQEDELKNVPLLIMANKQDVEGCLTDMEISDYLGLNNVLTRQWAIFKTCGRSGKGIDDSFKWLTTILRNC